MAYGPRYLFQDFSRRTRLFGPLVPFTEWGMQQLVSEFLNHYKVSFPELARVWNLLSSEISLQGKCQELCFVSRQELGLLIKSSPSIDILDTSASCHLSRPSML
ncbi:hypothetical protein Q3G72_023393 [Acer saccharum]|nr:hypothetical protein Q3G72_023393 [Acer saccharum]